VPVASVLLPLLPHPAAAAAARSAIETNPFVSIVFMVIITLPLRSTNA
jgi:hypothetical protein